MGGDNVSIIRQDYGKPSVAEQTGGTDATTETSSGYTIHLDWDATYDQGKPIGSSYARWTIATPNPDMSCPNNPTWVECPEQTDTSGRESYTIVTDSKCGFDQCLYTQIVTKTEDRYSYSAITLRVVGDLKKPKNLAVSDIDTQAFTAKVAADNDSAVDDTVLAIIFSLNGTETVVGILEDGDPYKTVQCPEWTSSDKVLFGVRAVLPKSISYNTIDGVTVYDIDPYMTSAKVWQSGAVAFAPTISSFERADDDIRIAWTNSWADANCFELSWSDNPNAWESTDAPDKFMVENAFASSWRIAGLDTGKTWYARIRSALVTKDATTYSPYSATSSINLATSPETQEIAVSSGQIGVNQGVTVSWTYTSTDGTPQQQAEIYEYENDTYTMIGKTTTQEHIDLPGWSTAGIRNICVRTISESGENSGYSDTVPITVVAAATCSEVDSLTWVNVPASDLDAYSEWQLTSLPLTVTVTGAGTSGTTSVVIKRLGEFHGSRPDEQEINGYDGETIYNFSQIGSATISVELEDLLGTLDDNGTYTLIARVTDGVGQIAEVSKNFKVNWSHKAIEFDGIALISDNVAVIRAYKPTGALLTDTYDIYRLSADVPVLVFENATFDADYVDPYPTIGENGGYRLAFRTAERCCVTSAGQEAFIDLDADFNPGNVIIDFGGSFVALDYDIDLSFDSDKDFEAKRFLGGSIKGYWKAGAKTTSNISAIAIPADDDEVISAMRRLRDYTGLCNVRTPEGSNFTADVQVQEKWDGKRIDKLAEFTMKVSKVDPEELDGMTYTEWMGI